MDFIEFSIKTVRLQSPSLTKKKRLKQHVIKIDLPVLNWDLPTFTL